MLLLLIIFKKNIFRFFVFYRKKYFFSEKTPSWGMKYVLSLPIEKNNSILENKIYLKYKKMNAKASSKIKALQK